MESLSGPFHSRKLSNAGTFSDKNTYDAVFSGHRRKYAGASAIDVQDYREIFANSQASSIPVLDLSTLREPSDAFSLDFRHSKPDYSKIFGGFRDEDIVVSYEELFGRDKARAPSSTPPASQDSDNLSHQSPDVLKQFNMSYNKINHKSKVGLDGTKHVTQSTAVIGFIRFIDEPVMEAEKQNPSAVNVSVDFSPKESSRNAVRKERNPGESIGEDKKSKTVDIKIQPSTVSSSPINVVNQDNNPRRSINSESCKTYFDNEFDVNSAASASSAALKKAIEKAQESIRIAKESVGRKKKGLRRFSDKKFKNSLKVEDGMEDETASEENKCRDEDSTQNFQDVGRKNKYGGTVVFPNFMDSEKLFVAKKFIDEIHEKISESVKESKFGDNTVVYNGTHVADETKSKPLDLAGKDEYATLCSEVVDTETSKIQMKSDSVHESQTDKMIVDEPEAGIKVSKSIIDIMEHQSVVKEVESEQNNSEVFQDFNQNDNENRLDASLELLENERQENVLEHEDSENAENEKHEEIEEPTEMVESENESKHDQDPEIHMDEETSDVFDRFCESDAKDNVQTCDNSLEESNQNAETCDDKLEESEVNLHDNCEIKQEDNHTVERKVESSDESHDLEFDEKSSGNDNVMEETDDIDCVHVADNVVEMNDIHVETTHEVDDVIEVDFCEKTSLDQTASDDNQDEFEVKSEENYIVDNLEDLGLDNDVRSVSSSGSAHGVKIIEESNIQQIHKEIRDPVSTNENEDSQEPESRQMHDEMEEPGPSEVSGKAQFRRINEEAAAKEREWERNRLAVERAIREARERAFAEARERAERERAAVEKATEEVRLRMMAEAHEKVSKASVTNKPSSEKTSAQSKLRAERAAVERATSEARQRALEKAISQKNVSDLNRSESALRTKAKLEKHNRIMERAAKALAEKEKRDRLAQKEQAERNRLAENLDSDIKRWSNGKEGNLRALLSTLQYILGPESGWQPVSLTEIVTSSAVKKAYRKATLCVHPDKLQQRGATIQHKYICEKVFDLLKAAWSRFNSEER